MTDSPRLLEPHELAELGPPEAVRLPASLIDANPQNPRKLLAEVEALADNIREFGLLQPVTVRRQGERYELLGGHRRAAAFALLREREPFDPAWRTIPAVVKTANDDTAKLMLISGQAHSRPWQPREEAAILEDLATTRTLPEIGALLHKSPEWVGHRLKVYADAVLSGYVQTGRLSMAVADELRQVKNPAVRREMAEQAVAEEWERDRARGEVRRLKSSGMVRDIDRLATALLEALALVQPGQVPRATGETLLAVRRRIMALARSGPVMPSIAEAEQAAGVRPSSTRRRKAGGRRAGYVPRIVD